MAVLGYLAKLKWGVGLAFDAHFLRDLFIKMFLISKVSMSHVISFTRYQTKCVIKWLFRQLMTT